MSLNELQQAEMDSLKARARQMGMNFSPNIGLDTLRTRVNAYLTDGKDPGGEEADEAGQTVNPFAETDESNAMFDAPDSAVLAPGPRLSPPSDGAPAPRPQSRHAQEAALRETQWREQMKLIRIRIACLNPLKKDLMGEFITVSNRYLGTVKKFIPYGEASENGYHVPQILLTELMARKFQQIKSVKDKDGRALPQVKLVPEYAIEILEPLTEAELATLARNQAAAAGL